VTALHRISTIGEPNDDVPDAGVRVERGIRMPIMKPRLQSADAGRAFGVSQVSQSGRSHQKI
jgi:hypothetical protein